MNFNLISGSFFGFCAPVQKVALAGDASQFVCIDHLDRLIQSNARADLNAILILELTALFDLHGIRTEQLLRAPKKSKRTISKDNLFGRNLDELVQRDARKFNWQAPIPLMLQQLIEYIRHNGLEEEGILRIAASVPRTQSLCDELNKLYACSTNHTCGCTLDQMLNHLLSEYSICDCIAVFKQFIRKLPQPLLTFKLLDAFLATAHLPGLEIQLQTLNVLILLLPTVHRFTLKQILILLNDICSKSDNNKMTLPNVATIIAPNLFPNFIKVSNKEMHEFGKSSEHQIARALDSCKVTQLLINYADILFVVPPFLTSQLRQMQANA